MRRAGLWCPGPGRRRGASRARAGMPPCATTVSVHGHRRRTRVQARPPRPFDARSMRDGCTIAGGCPRGASDTPLRGSYHRVYPTCIVNSMTVSYALLGLLAGAARHGDDLKQSYDRRYRATRPLRFGQVYRTLAQRQRDGLVEISGVESGAGPDRKRYSITAEGVTDLERWLSEPEDPQPQLQTVLFQKVVLALLSGRPAEAFLDAQRDRHL